MKWTSILYYIAALVLLILCMSFALPFLKNLTPGIKFAVVILPVIFLLLTHFTPGEIIKAFRLSGRKSVGTVSEYRNAHLFFQSAQHYFVAWMLIGAVVLVVWFLASGPNSRHIAHPVAIMTGGFFWPLIFILFLCLPFKSALRKKIHELPDQGGSSED